ncbi:ABC transporter permease [Bacillus sp. C28GYM-DRY-1]|uniref:ABC transporter permease n=1 Tax=Bacillus sp. C28GYM-DRY-1 TaxID=3062686 RepID=UPI0026750545|nr:ABC transporter permease subunit [Bacillus sp. C28GYM-DRY-1]MDO3661945.1 ABC transporter permease subunit [Bacillus sp. C28GYM-DRY-1]
MKVMITLLQKEWLDGWKSGKLIWLPIAMMIVGLTQPLTIYYMPEIIEHGGNLPDGMKISFTMPSGSEVMVSTLSQFNTLGMALIVFSVMGCVANERNQGVTSLIMSRPVTAVHYIVSKWLTQSVIGIASFAAGYGLAYYYIQLLFEDTSFSRFAGSLALYALWIMFIVTAGLAGSTMFRSLGAAAAAGIGLTAAVSFVVSLFPDGAKWLPATLCKQAEHIILHGERANFFGWSLTFSILCIVLLAMFSVWRFRRYESY